MASVDLERFVTALCDGEAVVVRGWSSLGAVKYFPCSGDDLAVKYAPERQWDDDRETYDVYESCRSRTSTEQVRETLAECVETGCVRCEILTLEEGGRVVV
jgi:hypothetical protein